MEKFTTIFNRLLLATVLVCILSISAANAMDIADEDITTAIEADLFADSQLPVNKIDIETNEGIVKLSGTVDNILAKDRTEKIAESIVGVRSIVNLIEVDPPAHITDINIKKDVEQALIFDPATNSDDIEIEVEVDQGIVTLSGTASSWQQKRLCSTVAKGVKGVTEIVNNIKIEYGIERSDDQIKDEIQAMLSNDIKVDDAMIYIEVEDGNVMLKGSVGSLAEKNSARMLSWVSGVENVNTDHLEIKWWARDSMRRKKMYISRSDDEIEKAVTDAIMYDPRVNYFDINIDVKFGKVILSGVVDNLKAKKAAEWDAKNTIGVSIVNNNIRIRFAEDVSDDNLTSAITENFKSDPYLERFDIEVIVIGGKVYLYGDVNTSWEQNYAEKSIENFQGVIDVFNNIEARNKWTWRPDWEIKQNVEDQIMWSPFVDGDDITVSVKDGVVTLRGEVETYSEGQSAVDNAYEGGAKKVENDLDIHYEYYGPYHYSPYSPPYYYPYYSYGYYY